MNFRLELNIKPFVKQINIRDRVLLSGSCFTDHISRRLSMYKFNVLENPNGILFNPASIGNAIDSYILKRHYSSEELFLFNDLWASWDHHSDFSHPEQETTFAQINDAVIRAHEFLKASNWLIITLGSSFVYELKDDSLKGKAGAVAANCHKVPAQHFVHRLMHYDEVEKHLDEIVIKTKAFNPAIQIVFTISPVRHFREGLVENNRSKALLHTAVHAMLQKHMDVSYFPSFELVIDDLRDYRFYAEDMVHPNYQATHYVWEKFSEALIDDGSRAIMKDLLPVWNARNHKAMHPGSMQHKNFLETTLGKTKQLALQYPFLDFNEEIAWFKNALSVD